MPEVGADEMTVHQVDAVVRAAEAAFQHCSDADDEDRARWLEGIAKALDCARQSLIDIAVEETHLPRQRLEAEVGRTVDQLRMFAAVVREGAYLEAILDSADSEATPPRPDLRRVLVPLGPIAVYAASNFPFAFSVAGGDTASALAVGCPVVVKAHPAQPRLSRATADIVSRALVDAGAHSGAFGFVTGHEAGVALIEHPSITAAAFTGSLDGGRSLFDRAAARSSPIPFYGELASINPVVVTASADHARGDALAAGLAQSFQLGAGQFCTKPGLVFVPLGSRLERQIVAEVTEPAHEMLSASISRAFVAGTDEHAKLPGVTELTTVANAAERALFPRVFATNAATFLEQRDALGSEVFGAVTVLVNYASEDELLECLGAVPGSLTGTLHAEPGDETDGVVRALADRCGRVVFDGWPTGVAVTWSQHHGGPYPSTTSVHTSVGATAVRRFQRPVVYQDAPQSALPRVLRDGNPLGVPRRVDGILGSGSGKDPATD